MTDAEAAAREVVEELWWPDPTARPIIFSSPGYDWTTDTHNWSFQRKAMERITALLDRVRGQERERCAQVVDAAIEHGSGILDDIAAAIRDRQRGQQA